MHRLLALPLKCFTNPQKGLNFAMEIKFGKIIQWLAGPELFWMLLICMVHVLIKITNSPSKGMDAWWLSMYWVIPLLLVPLSYLVYCIPFVSKNWLLARMFFAGVIGGHIALEKSLGAHTEQGPGIGTAYMIGIFLVIIVLMVMTIVLWIKT